MYQTSDGNTKLGVRLENDSVWLTQAQIMELFGRDRTVITKHINNIFREGELDEKSNVHFLHLANSDKPVKIYNLDVIISVGYRVKSPRGTQFRMWANKVLKEYLVKGVVINQQAKVDQLQEALKSIKILTGIATRSGIDNRQANDILQAAMATNGSEHLFSCRTEEKDVMVKVVVNLINRNN